MKFLAHHKKEVEQLINSHDLTLSSFSYVKKKGRINIIHIVSNDYFAYLRKKEMSINESTHQWEEKIYYKVQVNYSKETIIDNWELVLSSFDKWLSTLYN